MVPYWDTPDHDPGFYSLTGMIANIFSAGKVCKVHESKHQGENQQPGATGSAISLNPLILLLGSRAVPDKNQRR